MSRRQRDAFLRNRRPTKQQRLDKPPKRKMPKKGTKVRILHSNDDIDLARRAMATLQRWGYLCELVKDE